jgi:hypothetical protein
MAILADHVGLVMQVVCVLRGIVGLHVGTNDVAQVAKPRVITDLP